MTEAVPAVALLFDDGGLGEQLRDALKEHGARIVHEGPLAGLSRELLRSVEADVLVVNLDDQDDAALDRLDEALDGDRPRVVFNDAQASRRLEGWDRARWARHLAMKVLAVGDADPPRPAASEPSTPPEPPILAEAPAPAALAEPATLEPVAAPVIVEEARQAAASETLAAELEALLASDAPAPEIDEFGTGLNYAAGEATALHDGDFGLSLDGGNDEPGTAEPVLGETAVLVDAHAASMLPVVESVASATIQLDHLELAPLEDDAVVAVPRAAMAPTIPPRLSDNWTLLDPDAPAASPAPDRASLAEFGIEKLSAADFLAPDADAADESPISPGLSLELVSIQDAIAPQHFEPAPEMGSSEPAGPLPRLVVLGATTESTASVGEFLATLPDNLPVAVLHTQHLAGRAADGLVEHLASLCALPVRLAEPGMRMRVGEVVVVPSDRQVAVRRDGSLELQPVDAGATHAPSIDTSFTQAATAFGADLLAIVFAGRSTDAVAGCQAVHDRGGQVWVEVAGGAHAADMVSGVLAERLSHYAGTPRELAARLAEQNPEGQR